ncbi:ABC transporter substrate-binding protein [Streptosporangium lutulentum]|uniref:ABC-type nitrate/sulfonate/bicarbonate transport system substrate-binding protein n=1 Tax=Streptosporangium lutulentum TaxID=1461250 RepID=A0ABT9Q6Z4_9ACTN|nr:ABC transporter substrate-binding protein [Streptosporangium lutulentum]MDP9842437.1 ABC-type nitrate/sulfonate/bicarbonate transport system substrate-binding protein [Streptosporangium lutulentum]
MNGFTRCLGTIGVSLLFAGSLAGCGGSGDSAGTAAGGGAGNAPMDAVKANVPKSETDVSGTIDKSKVKKSLVVGVDNPYYLFHHDIEVALVKGYFKEFGIDSVEIKTIEDPLPPLIGGSLDLALYDTDTAITAAKKSGQGLRFLSVYLGGEANILGVGKGITSGADLKGKTITGGQFGSRNDAIIRQLLRDNGVEPDRDVKIVSTGGQSNERLQSVIAGTVDGASIQLRHRTVLEKAGGKVLFQETREVPQSGWSANKLLQESPETVTAFLAATLKARQFITDQANKDEVLTIMRDRKFDIPAEYADAYGAENAPDYHVSDGGFKPADMDKFIGDQIAYKTVPEGTDWREFTYLLPLWRAQKALGLPLNPALADM